MATSQTSLAPIALFVFNRLDHLTKTIEALKNNREAKRSDLIVFSDGPRHKEDQEKIVKIRKYLEGVSGFKSIKVVKQSKNIGLANSIIKGVTEVVSKSGRVIVLEDDIVTSKYFLKYMNQALEVYLEDEDVISIHGYIYPVKSKLPETFFLLGADCWGWATWKRGWDLFEPNGKKLRESLYKLNLVSKFNWDGSADYMQMLNNQIEKKNDSWAVRWLASAIVKNKYTLYPGKSLVRNIGLDGSGTHCEVDGNLDVEVESDRPVILTRQVVAENKTAVSLIKKYFRRNKKGAIDFLKEKLLYFYQRFFSKNKFGWEGDYDSWDKVVKLSSGYQSNQILDKVFESSKKVKDGKAIFERDSVVFNQIEYSWPVLSGLMWSASRNNGCLRVVDFGGSLGSSFFQNKKFFDGLKLVDWSIKEQSDFVKKGRETFAIGQLSFFESLEECVKVKKPNVLLLSSVLQYIEQPYNLIKEIVALKIEMIIIDRTSLVIGDRSDRLTLQRVDPSIYPASYPCWFFNEKRLKKAFEKEYRLVESFPALDYANIDSEFKGYIFLRK